VRGTRAMALTSALALTLAIGGCGNGSISKPKADSPTPVICNGCDPPNRGIDPSAAGPNVIKDAVSGGIVTVLTDHGLDGTLDPSGASDPAAVSILSGLVTRSLTQYRYDPRSREMVLVPDLATDLGQHNDNYTKWLFSVRPGIRFEDGARVTPADVVRGVRRCRHARPFASSPCLDVPFASVDVHAQHYVQFRFDEPYPDLPYLAATPAIGPVPPGTTDRYGPYARRPAATGPYRVERYRRGHRLVLVRNPHWDPKTDPARTQYPDRYIVRGGISRGHIQRRLLRDEGSAQTTLTLDDVRPGPFQRSATAAKRLVLGSKPCTTYLSPDNRRVTDPRVRRALVWAYPYRAALRADGLVRGVTAVPATNLVPPNVPGRAGFRVAHHHGFETSPRMARQMLSRAHAVGTPLRFFYDRSGPGRRLRDALVHSLRASGFDPRPLPAPVKPFPGQTPANQPVDLRTTTLCGAWPSGGEWLEPAYRPTHPDRTGPLFANTEAFSMPSVDHLMRLIERLPFDQVAEAWNRLDHQVLVRHQPIVPLWYAGVAMAHGSRIEGMQDDTVHGMPTWGRIWVSPPS
jgi:peptide/nickel transport system substrate-binding protein